MPISVHYMPPRAERAGHDLLREFLRAHRAAELPDYSGVLILCPTQAILDEIKRKANDGLEQCHIPPRAHTLRQYARSVCAKRSDALIVPTYLRPAVIRNIESACGMGLATLTSQMITELKHRFPGLGPEDMGERIKEAFGHADLPEAVASRANEAMDRFGNYAKALGKAGAIDEDDLIADAAAMLVARLEPIKAIVLAGFYEMTNAELGLTQALIASTGSALSLVPVASINDDLSHCYATNLKVLHESNKDWLSPTDSAPVLEYRPAPSMEEELEVMARLIKSRHIAGLPGHRELDRVCIVFPKPETYREMAGRVFRRYRIPVSSASASRTLLKSRPYRDLLAMVEAVAGDYPRLTFARALTSPFFERIPDSVKLAAARAALKPGMVKGYDAWRTALKTESAGEEAAPVFQSLREFKTRLHDGSFEAMAGALGALAEDLGFKPQPDIEGYEPRTLGDILQPLSLLDRLRDLSSPHLRPGEFIHPQEAASHQRLGEFIEALEAVMGHATETEPRPGVRIMSIYEARGLAPDILYMGGLRDGELPARPDLDFLLPDTVRKTLGLVDMKRHLHLQEHIFTRLARAAHSVTLTYPEMEGDNLYLPSVFLDGMREVRAPLLGIYTEMEQMLAECPPGGSAFVHEAPAVKVYKPEDSLRVTDVDAYRTCPRRFFIERVIGAEPAELAEYEVDPRTTGTLSHLVMEHFMRSGGPLGSMAEERLSEAIDAALKGQGLDPYFAGLFRETFMQALPEITKVEEKIEKDGYRFSEAERPVKGEPVPGIRLRGKVDRIDLDASGRASVMDYKTGTADISGSQVLAKGKALQMFLYASMLKDEGLRPERVGLYTFGQIKTKFVPSSLDMRKERGMDEFMDAALGYLKETAARIWAGDFRATPMDESACFGCHEAPYCPYIQGISKAEDAR